LSAPHLATRILDRSIYMISYYSYNTSPIGN
jgi:hypothetical protein